MTKIIQSTERGQITLPKSWRDQFNTKYYIIEIKAGELNLKPLPTDKTLKDEVENSWQEYKNGKFIGSGDLIKKYDL